MVSLDFIQKKRFDENRPEETGEGSLTPEQMGEDYTGEGDGGGNPFRGGNANNIAGSASTALSTTAEVFGTETDGSDKAGIKNTVKMTTSYADLGYNVGGGWGALVGGIVGLSAGLFRANSERRKATKRREKAYKDELRKDVLDREKAQSMLENETRINNLIDLQKKQLGYY